MNLSKVCLKLHEGTESCSTEEDGHTEEDQVVVHEVDVL